MITLFRKIRKKLIEDDNIRKYLLDAIGEIPLVVIGILIALQVNNWNESSAAGRDAWKKIRRLQNDSRVTGRG